MSGPKVFEWSLPPPPPSMLRTLCLPCTNMPLHIPHIHTMETAMPMPLMLICIDTTVNILNMYILSTESAERLIRHRKRLKSIESGDGPSSREELMQRFECGDDTLEHPHHKQVLDLITWQIGIMDAKWCIKPRSTVGLRSTLQHIPTIHIL